ncbi:L,D-transpeptidase [Effusibacillus pohliae]|uniref:L,D-transpeptidase n=1 Tax=Effusibacillus pohliae TaxID=232270 RepID=UPI000477DFCE|nr:L,D-transpeptidase [Effusibacillus pohliae]
MKRAIRMAAFTSLVILATATAGCGQLAQPAKDRQQPVAHASSATGQAGASAASGNDSVADQSRPADSVKQDTTAVPVNWMAPSGGNYPKIQKGDPIWIDISIKDQRVYIKKGDETIYTMVTSSGLDTEPDNSTPRGTFYVEPERDTWFFSPQYQEGAKYWVSWKNHGEFLFHSVPMDKNGNVIEAEARKLGQKASHGCLRLTVPDAKWIYDNIPVKTKVVIRD